MQREPESGRLKSIHFSGIPWDGPIGEMAEVAAGQRGGASPPLCEAIM